MGTYLKEIVLYFRKKKFVKSLIHEQRCRIWSQEITIFLYKNDLKNWEKGVVELEKRLEELKTQTTTEGVRKTIYDTNKALEEHKAQAQSLKEKIDRSEREVFDKKTVLIGATNYFNSNF